MNNREDTAWKDEKRVSSYKEFSFEELWEAGILVLTDNFENTKIR